MSEESTVMRCAGFAKKSAYEWIKCWTGANVFSAACAKTIFPWRFRRAVHRRRRIILLPLRERRRDRTEHDCVFRRCRQTADKLQRAVSRQHNFYRRTKPFVLCSRKYKSAGFGSIKKSPRQSAVFSGDNGQSCGKARHIDGGGSKFFVLHCDNYGAHGKKRYSSAVYGDCVYPHCTAEEDECAALFNTPPFA